jgi:hypothetical protein
MVNTHEIISPFSNHPTQQRPGPGKNVRLVTPSHRISQAVPVSKATGESSSNGQVQSMNAQATIYSVEHLRELPDSYNTRPSVRSWSSFRDSTYGHNEEKPLPPTPVSPLYERRRARRDSAVSTLGPVGLGFTEESRNEVDAKAFPLFQYTTNTPEEKYQHNRPIKVHTADISASAPRKAETKPPVTQTHATKASNGLAEFYRNAQGMYDAGPRGEGQQAWTSYKQYKKEKQGHAEVKENHVKQTHIKDLPRKARDLYRAGPKGEGQELWDSYKQYKKAKSGHSEVKAQDEVKAPRRGPPLETSTHRPAHVHGASPAVGRPSVGGYSLASREVPIGIQLAPRFIITNKPLPPVPQLQPAPAPRKQVGRNSPESLWATAQEAKVGLTAQRWGAGAKKPVQKGPVNSTPWWKALAIKIPGIDVLSLVQSKSDADRQKDLKAKISRPILQQVDLASETNVSGRARITPSQIHRPERPSERQKGKQKVNDEASAKHLWQKYTPDLSSPKSPKHDFRRRKSSDVSFACAGVSEDSWAYAQDPGPSRQYQAQLSGHESLRPKPLFSGVRGGHEGPRDTGFYRPYHELLDEYREAGCSIFLILALA